jgi:hypothetical protein
MVASSLPSFVSQILLSGKSRSGTTDPGFWLDDWVCAFACLPLIWLR